MTSKRILDAGCGIGRFIYNLARKEPAHSYYGIDIDQKNIVAARRSYPSIEFEEMSVEDLRLPDQEFDMVYSRDVLEHVDNPARAVSEMSRVLKPRGQLIIKVPAEKSEKWLLQIRPTYFSEIHHVRIFKKDEIEKLVEQYSLKLVKKEPQAFLDHLFLYVLFKTTKASEGQLALGSWKNHWTGWIVAPIHAYLKPELVFHTWLKYVPIWVITLPVGYIINQIGNQIFPKSMYYEFTKL